MKRLKISGKVWKYEGPAGWYFVYVSRPISKKIEKARRRTVGWGYVPIKAMIGESTWKTTLFPSKKEGVYLLAIKASVRRAEGIEEGDTVSVSCALL